MPGDADEVRSMRPWGEEACSQAKFQIREGVDLVAVVDGSVLLLSIEAAAGRYA